MTQKDFVELWLKENGEITPLDAYREFAIMRLSSIILKLKRKGLDIKTELTPNINRFGKKVRHATYKLKRTYKVTFMPCIDKTYVVNIDAYDEEDMKENLKKKTAFYKLIDYYVMEK